MISTIGSLTQVTDTTATTTSSNSSIGQEDFLNILLAEMQNQDPLDPMDNTEYTAVLAQFSSLSQLSSMSAKLDTIAASIEETSVSQAAALVGDEMSAAGNVIRVDGSSSSMELSYDLSAAAASGEINIYDANGLLVDTLEFSSQEAGQQAVSWDTTDVSSGNYTFEVAAYDSSGTAVTASTIMSGVATGITVEDGSLCFIINGQNIAYEDIISIKQAT